MDIVAQAKFDDKVYRFNIQCKYNNRVIDKTPIQEIFAGTAFYKYPARTVVIVNNVVTY